MAKSKSVITVEVPLKATIKRIPFQVSPSVAYLDAAKLSKAAKAEINIGFFQYGGSRRNATAIIKKGMVERVQIESCAQCKPATPQVLRILKKALGGSGQPKKLRPVPVVEFLRDPTLILGTGPSAGCWAIIKDGSILFCCITTQYPFVVCASTSVGKL